MVMIEYGSLKIQFPNAYPGHLNDNAFTILGFKSEQVTSKIDEYGISHFINPQLIVKKFSLSSYLIKGQVTSKYSKIIATGMGTKIDTKSIAG